MTEMTWSRGFVVIALGAGLALSAGCGDAEGEDAPGSDGSLSVSDDDVTKAEVGKADSSIEAVFLDMDFSGELRTTSSWSPEREIEKQLLYTIGQLNGDDSVGRLDKLRLREVKTERGDDGAVTIRYQATLQVAWGKRNDVPASYTLLMPRDVSSAGLEGFTQSYKESCVDFGAHDVDAGSMWYYYRPGAYRCKLAEEDIFRFEAEVSVSPVNTTGKYPEYDKVWEDGVLNVVAVFGKYKDGATSSADAGISGYNRFSDQLADALRAHGLETTPEALPSSPGVETPEITYRATLDDGHAVVVHTILVDNVRTAGAEFDRWYAERSKTADLIIYNGHAGLGSNIRALARKGDWQTGQYAVVFMNGCDTYAYVDSALFDAHAEVNPDDPEGTKHLDLVTNAMPSYFVEMPRATLAFVKGLMSWDDPRTFEQIFTSVSDRQIVLVSGEQDNTYQPGGEGDGPVEEGWEGLKIEDAVTKDQEIRFTTPQLPAGRYTFLMEGDADADLYVRIGLEPTTSSWDCRPYKSGSNEVCQIELSAPGTIHGMVRGWAARSSFTLLGDAD